MTDALPPAPLTEHGAAPLVVGIGASAGGLEALQAFFAAEPASSGAAYVVVQHMASTRKPMLATLLQSTTAMPVLEATDGLLMRANHVYVGTPGCTLTVSGGRLRSRRELTPSRPATPIDTLFASMAQDLGPRAICVVLSGMGDDGSRGLRQIKQQGGLTLAQAPASARFAAMPQAAVDTGSVDVICPPADMPARIQHLVHTRRNADDTTLAAARSSSAFGDILALLRAQHQCDLSLYKRSTLLRRIDRRVTLLGLPSMQAYAAFLRDNPQEHDLLFKEMLIGVTSFFRDPALWSELKEQVLPALMTHQAPRPLRAWVVGCSTGEEAYSLAMVFLELRDSLPAAADCSLQIFATDLNADAIAVARKGQYPAQGIAHLSADRQARFFSSHGPFVQVDKALRDRVLFARHDVIQDPPFTKLDLLLCRNVLIYFGNALQRRLISLFHYSLRPGGMLALGLSETVGRTQDRFAPQVTKAGLYLRNDDTPPVTPAHFQVSLPEATSPTGQEPNLSSSSKQTPINLQALTDQLLLQTLAPAAVLVNSDGDILYINGRTGRYLEPAAGKANWNIHVMARPELRTPIATSVRQTLQDGLPAEALAALSGPEPGARVRLTARALQEPAPLRGLVMITLRDLPADEPDASPVTESACGVAPDALADELARARAEIQALRQDMNASHDSLHAANEALQASNEELQSANEELTASKEEAQSLNEELQTINGELQAKLDDLVLAQSDMQNLLNATDIATLFLDSDLNVRRYTDRAALIFHLREVDIGRPLSELANTLRYPELFDDSKATLGTLTHLEKQVQTLDGRWLAVRIMPYRTQAYIVQGLVLTFFDITEAKSLEARLRQG
ncbi:MAG: hypothetical protein RI907_3671 [Pseudomonadota bacterium]|jgi:two-component system CheB/CheR fusion protein